MAQGYVFYSLCNFESKKCTFRRTYSYLLLFNFSTDKYTHTYVCIKSPLAQCIGIVAEEVRHCCGNASQQRKVGTPLKRQTQAHKSTQHSRLH